MNIYVGNLAWAVRDEDLRTAFERFGTVDSAKVIMDRESGRSRGFGFVEMANKEEGENAIKAMNGTDMEGRPLRVNEAQPRGEGRGPGGPRRF